MNGYYFDKRHMLYNQNKSCVKSCQNHCFKKPIVFKKKRIVFQHVHFLSHCFETKIYHWLQLFPKLLFSVCNSVNSERMCSNAVRSEQQCHLVSWLFINIITCLNINNYTFTLNNYKLLHGLGMPWARWPILPNVCQYRPLVYLSCVITYNCYHINVLLNS